MIVRVRTANRGEIIGMVSDSLDVVRLLKALAHDGVKCISWRLEHVD